MYINEAFQTLNSLNEDTFSISDTEEIRDVLDSEDDTIDVIDLEAEDIEELETDYVGKVILSCNVCNSLQYKDPDTIEIDEEDECVDKEVECPVCLCSNGYKIVGKVVDFDEHEIVGEIDDEDEEEITGPEHEVELDVEDNEEIESGDNLEEGIFSKKNNKVDKKKTFKQDGYEIRFSEDNEGFVIDNEKEDRIVGPVFKDFDSAFKWFRKHKDASGKIKESLKEAKDYPEYEGLPDDLFTKVYDALVTGSSNAKARNVLDYKFPRFNYEVVTTTKDKDTGDYVINIKLGKNQSAQPIIDVANHFNIRVEKVDNKDPYFKSIYKLYIPADQVVEENLREEMQDETKVDLTLSYNDYVFDEETGNISIFKDNVYIDKNKDYFNIEFKDDNDDKVIQYKRISEDPEVVTFEYIKTMDKELEEDFKEVKIVTDDQEMKMTSDDEGKVVVTTEPLKKEFYDDSETEIQIDDFDSESFDELTEKYLHEVYDNVKRYSTKKVTAKNNKIKVEGLINFNSNKIKPTCFIFEAATTNKNKVRFNGQNKHLANRDKAFSLKGRVEENKLVCESLTYNYTVKNGKLNESVKIYGNVKL